MDKYEFNIKVDQIKKLVGKNDFQTAMKIADTIDWRRVRNANLLSMIASVYEKNEEYQEAKDILLIAFERAPVGKRLLYKLTQLAVKQGNIQEAESYYQEFCDLAGEDSRQDVLRYLILKAKGASMDQLIHALESYTSTELDEKWLYELAELYHQAGMADQCVRTCDKIMLMFGLGQYVDKAMELKLQYAPLTKYQMDLVENRDKYEEKLRMVEQNGIGAVTSPQAGAVPVKMAQTMAQRQPESIQGVTGEGIPVRMQPEPRPIPVPPPSQTFYEAEQGIAAPIQQAQDEMFTGISASLAPEPAETAGGRVTTQEQLVASVREAEVEASLAQEMSKISIGDYTEEPIKAQTRVLNDVKELTQAEALAGKTKVLEDIRHIQEIKPVEAGAPVKEKEKKQIKLPHMMVEARESESGLEIAVEILKEIHQILQCKHPVAKISGEKLDQKGVLSSASKLAGKDLIIEEAGDLSDEMLEELDQLLRQNQHQMVVMMVDNSRQLSGICKACPPLAEKFQRISTLEEGETALAKLCGPNVGIARAAFAKQAAKQTSEMPPSRPASEAPRAVRTERTRAALEESEDAVSARTRAAGAEPVRPARSERVRSVGEEPERAELTEPVSGKAQEEYPAARMVTKETPRDEFGRVISNSQEDDKEVMGIDEFAQYCCQYASQIDCNITGKSMLALYERIEIMEEDGIPLTKAEAEDLIEEAADKAEKPSFGKRLTGIFSSKYDKDGLLILKEEHFI